MNQPKKKMSLGRKIVIGIGVITAIGIISALIDDDTKAANTKLAQLHAAPPSEKPVTPEPEDIKQNTITAAQLMSAYTQNEVKADEDFKDKVFYVAGTITDIKKDLLDHIYVTLKTADGFRQVQCYVEDKNTAAQLNKGMQATFKGTCAGLTINVLMKDCELIAAK